MDDKVLLPRLSPSVGTAQLAAWTTVGVVASVVTQLTLPRADLLTRMQHHALNTGQHVALGGISFAALCAWRFLHVRRTWVGHTILFVLWFSFGLLVLREDLSLFASKIASGRSGAIVLGALVVAVALGLTAIGVAHGKEPRWIRLIVGVSFGLAIATGNGLVLQHDYPGVHLLGSAAAASLLSLAVADVRKRPSRRTGMVLVCIAPWALWSVATRPPNAVAVDLYRASGSVVAPWLVRLRGPSASTWSASTDPWLRSRRSVPELPPSTPPALPSNGVVLLFTADCVRADVVSNPAYLSRFPALSRLRREAAHFSAARSSAPATAQSLASIFTSTLYSQLRWGNLPGEPKHFYPFDDPTPRFTELLHTAGVRTANVQGLPGISVRTGLVRGMQIERLLPREGRRFAGASAQLPVILEILRQERDGPLFLYAHFDDPHAPYDRAGTEGTPFEAYLREIGLVDSAIGGVLRAIDELGMGNRTAVIFSADHGEAFGEHGMTSHATTLYDEQLRVPLLVKVPNLPPRELDTPVTLVDLGPTILDLMRLPTPGHAMGRSLLPLMRGETPDLDRPIAFESGRAQRGVLFKDRTKLIVDMRAGTVELYDLAVDPGELRNLAQDRLSLTQERRAWLEEFFLAHAFKAPGYELPYAR